MVWCSVLPSQLAVRFLCSLPFHFSLYKQNSKRRLSIKNACSFSLYLDERDKIKLKFHIIILLVKYNSVLWARGVFFPKQACTTVCVVVARFGDLFTGVPFISKFLATDKAFKYFLSEKEDENCLKLEPSSHSLEYCFSLWEDHLVQSN